MEGSSFSPLYKVSPGEIFKRGGGGKDFCFEYWHDIVRQEGGPGECKGHV